MLNEKDDLTRKILCELIGEIQGTLLIAQGQINSDSSEIDCHWPECMPFIWDLFKKENVYYILKNLIRSSFVNIFFFL